MSKAGWAGLSGGIPIWMLSTQAVTLTTVPGLFRAREPDKIRTASSAWAGAGDDQARTSRRAVRVIPLWVRRKVQGGAPCPVFQGLTAQGMDGTSTRMFWLAAT